MRRTAKAKGEAEVAVALTWDGARVSVSGLSAKARKFLRGVAVAPTPKRMAELLAERMVKEIRVCWVPRLSGGREVLALPFSTAEGKRAGFRAVRQVPLGECLGVVYRR